MGNLQQAIASYEQQLFIAREIGDREEEAIASWNLGLTYEQQGDLTRAVALMQLLVDFEREVGHANAEKDAEELEKVRQRLSQARP